MSQTNCIQSRHVSEPCDICRRPTKVVHLPNRPMGFYCEDHCPVCAEEIPIPHTHIADTRADARMEPALASH